MEEEEDAEMQEAIRRSMNDYTAMHAAAAAACTSWSPATAATSSSPSLHHHPTHRSIHVPLQQQHYPYRPQIQVPLPLQQQQLQLQLRTPSSSSLEGAGGALRTGRGSWEGSSSPLSAAASPLRSTPSPSAAAAVSSAASPFPLRASVAAGSARAGGLESSSVAAFREHRTGATAGPAAGPRGLSAAGRFAAVHAVAAGQAGGSNNWPTERTPSSMNWLCDAEELFHPRQQQQQQQRLPVLQHQQQQHHYHCPQHQQRQHSPSRALATSLPLSSCFSLRQQQHQQSPAQLRQLQVSEQPYVQLATQQQQFLLEEQLQQQQGREDERYASIATGGSEEDENVALQKAIQESLLTCPSAFRSSQQLTTPQDTTAAAAKDNAKTSRGGEAAAGGTAARREGVGWTRRDEEEEEQQQQYELHSPSSSRLLSLPVGTFCAARGYPEDISEFLLPPPQQQEVRERQTQRQKRSTLPPLGLQQQGQPMQLRRQQEEEQDALQHAATAGGREPLRSQKAPTDRCKTPVSWIGEEAAEEAARENPYFSSSSFSSPPAVAGGSRLCAPQPTAFSAAADAPGGAAGLGRGERKAAADDESSTGAPQKEPFSIIRRSADEGSSSGSSSNNGDISSLSRSRGRKKNDDEMRGLLLQKMQPLPAEPDLKELLDIVFGEEGMNREIDPSDLSRWFHHPFLFAGDVPAPSLSPVQKAAEEEDPECEWLVNSSTQWREKASCCLWGLVQLHGGPCGLLAAVQCFLLRALLFSPGRVKRYARLLGLQRRQQQQQQPPEQPQQQREGVEAAAEGDKEGDARPQEGQRTACPSSRRDSRSCGDSNSPNTSRRKGEYWGERNVELSSLLPSPLTRRHALVEALAAVLYQCTPVSLYTVAYVLPANVRQLQQPPAPAAEDEALLSQADTSSNSHLRRRSSSGTRSATAGAASAADTEAGEQREAAAALRQMREETEAAARNSEERERGSGRGGRERGKRKEDEVGSVSEMLEDVRVYVRRFTHIEDVMHFYSQFYDVLLAGETGVISFLFSVLLTRGIQQVANDMDMPGHSLIGVYGHCSQDLVNLLLLGAASSNVFDGDRKLGSFTATSAAPVPAAASQPNEEGGTEAASTRGGRSAGESAAAAAARGQAEAAATDAGRDTPAEKRKNADDKEEEEEQTHLKGVRKRPLAGFLSEMEALRYCEVGSRYKHPHFPLWVVGSSNHYTTLFSRDLLAAAVPTARLAEIEAQAAFRDFDRDGNFLILTEHLAALLAQLGQQERLLEAQRATSAAEGVVLLSDFLKWYSQVMAQQRSQSGEDVEPPQKFTVYIYDGQTPPGPSLRRFLVEARSSDSNSNSNNGEAEAEEMRRLLSTRWPGAAVSELPLLPLHLSSHA